MQSVQYGRRTSADHHDLPSLPYRFDDAVLFQRPPFQRSVKRKIDLPRKDVPHRFDCGRKIEDVEATDDHQVDVAAGPVVSPDHRSERNASSILSQNGASSRETTEASPNVFMHIDRSSLKIRLPLLIV